MSILESFKLTRDVASVFSLLFPPAASCIYSHCQRHGLAVPHAGSDLLRRVRFTAGTYSQ